MRSLIILFLCLFLCLPGLAKPTRAQAEQAISAYFANPLAGFPNPHLATIVQFASESDKVQVTLDPVVVPWTSESKQDYGLVGAFMAGNVEAQLLAGRAADQPEAGLARAFAVYDQIRQAHPEFRSPGLEKLRALASQGKLADYIRIQRATRKAND